MNLGHRADYIREKTKSPKPAGFEDISDNAFIEAKRNGKPATWHKFYWYVREVEPKDKSWAKRMNE